MRLSSLRTALIPVFGLSLLVGCADTTSTPATGTPATTPGASGTPAAPTAPAGPNAKTPDNKAGMPSNKMVD